MTDITEQQTMDYFMEGAKKAKSAARELAELNSPKAWTQVRSTIGQIQKDALKLYTGKPQTRTQTLALAHHIKPH